MLIPLPQDGIQGIPLPLFHFQLNLFTSFWLQLSFYFYFFIKFWHLFIILWKEFVSLGVLLGIIFRFSPSISVLRWWTCFHDKQDIVVELLDIPLYM